MTDDERRKWLAGLRPYDRVAVPSATGRYLRGCTLLQRREPWAWRPDDPIWDVTLDATDFEEERYHFLYESRLQPPPYPGMTGNIIVGPDREPEPRRRGPKPRAKASA
jgi:hypothetical protein